MLRDPKNEKEKPPLQKRIAALQTEVLKRPATGRAASKAFFNELSGEA